MRMIYIPEWLAGELAKALSWTLIHSLWQGLVAAIIAGVIIACTGHSKSQLRYNLLSGIFAFFLIVAGITFVVEYNTFKQDAAVPQGNTLSFQSPMPVTSAPGAKLLSSETSYLDQFISYSNKNASVIVLIWFFFFLVRCVKLISGICELRRFSTDIHHPSQSWQKKLGELKEKLGISKKIRLLESRRVQVPMTVGYLKATIFVPIGLLANLPADQVESILLHELAHIKRKDYLVNFMQSLAETVFFFNPAILWISSLIKEEREACCDDMVVENLPEKRSYLEALVSFQEYTTGTGVYAIGLTGRKTFLLERVKRLLTNENKRLNLFERTILLLSAIIITSFSFINSDPVKIIPVKAKSPIALQTGNNAEAHPNGLPTESKVIVSKTRDTVPGKPVKQKAIDPNSEFVSLLYDKTNDPQMPVLIYEATDRQANKFRITKENGRMTALSINDSQVPGGELENYQDLFRRIENFIRVTGDRKTQAILTRTTEQENNSLTKSNVPQKNKHRITDEAADKSEKINLDGDRKNADNGKSVDKNHKSSDIPRAAVPEKKKLLKPDESWKKDALRIEGVLQELVSEGIVANTSAVDWFGINETKMMVNGKEVPEALHGKLRSKYGIKKDMGLFYGPSQMYGPGIWFDKEDLR
jgi:bla regulator protein BlaR1